MVTSCVDEWLISESRHKIIANHRGGHRIPVSFEGLLGDKIIIVVTDNRASVAAAGVLGVEKLIASEDNYMPT